VAVTQTVSTLSPLQLDADAEVLAEDLQEVIEQLNWSAGKRPVCHLAADTLSKAITGSAVVVRRGTILTDADVQEITVGAVCSIAAGVTVDVVFSIDAVTKTLSLTDADDGTEVTDVYDVATDLSGATGELEFTISVQRTSVAGSPTLDFVRIAEEAVDAADLPAPTND
jgi:hypothetical protein